MLIFLFFFFFDNSRLIVLLDHRLPLADFSSLIFSQPGCKNVLIFKSNCTLFRTRKEHHFHWKMFLSFSISLEKRGHQSIGLSFLIHFVILIIFKHKIRTKVTGLLTATFYLQMLFPNYSYLLSPISFPFTVFSSLDIDLI